VNVFKGKKRMHTIPIWALYSIKYARTDIGANEPTSGSKQTKPAVILHRKFYYDRPLVFTQLKLFNLAK